MPVSGNRAAGGTGEAWESVGLGVSSRETGKSADFHENPGPQWAHGSKIYENMGRIIVFAEDSG